MVKIKIINKIGLVNDLEVYRFGRLQLVFVKLDIFLPGFAGINRDHLNMAYVDVNILRKEIL